MGIRSSVSHGNILLNISTRARQAPVKFMFRRVGYVGVSPVNAADQNSQEDLVETALTHGATDFDNIAGFSGSSLWVSYSYLLLVCLFTAVFQFTCEPDALLPLSSAITQSFSQRWNVDISELRYIPLEDSPEVSEDAKNDLKALIDELENNEDVLQVWVSSKDMH